MIESTNEIESGDIIKSAIGLIEVVIGSIVASEKPQVFSALIKT